MRYQNGYALDAALVNQLARRPNGVVDYQPNQYSQTEGPLAVMPGSSGTAIELDYNGGAARISPRGPVDIPAGTVSVPPGDANNPREDIIYSAVDSTVQVLPGDPADNQITDMQGSQYSPTGPQAPIPEPNSTAGVQGTILASVYVPAGASTSGDINQDHITDRRRRAIPRQNELWHNPGLTTDFNDYSANGGSKAWPIYLRDGWSFHLNSYAIMNKSDGEAVITNSNIALQIIEYVGDSETTVVWEKAAPGPTTNPEGREPITTIDSGGSSGAYAFRLLNESDVELPAISVTARYSMQPTGWY